MSNLNKAWVYLIFIGFGFLILTVLWEVYQISTGVKSNFQMEVIELERNYIFSPELGEHLKKAPDFFE